MTVQPVPPIEIDVIGARGENIYDTVRRLGLGGASPTESDAAAAQHYAEYLIAQYPETDLTQVLAAAAQITGSALYYAPVDDIVNAPTGSESNGTRYIVGTSPTGTFAGKAGYIAEKISGSWSYAPPRDFLSIFVISESANYGYVNSLWERARGEGYFEDFGVDATGATDVSTQFAAALAAFDTLYITKTYQIGFISVPSGKKITGNGKIIGKPGSGYVLNLEGDDCEVSGLTFDPNGNTNCIVSYGARCKVVRNTFIGNVDQHVFMLGASPEVSDNTFDGRNSTIGAISIVISGEEGGGKNFCCSNNRFYETGGFGIQTRIGAKNGVIAENVFKQPIYTDSKVATSGQTAFSFTLSRICSRFGVQVAGTPLNADEFDFDDSAAPTYAVTLHSGASSGQTVKLLGCRSLENININSNSENISVIGNSIDGSGDSGIVICADYHDGVLDPNNVDSGDFPHRITVSGNNISNAFAAGVAMTHPAPGTTITNNVIADCGQYTRDSVYPSGIVQTGDGVVVMGNTMENTLSPPTMIFGVNLNTFSTETGSADKPVKVGLNVFIGTFTKKYEMLNGATGARRQAVEFIGGYSAIYPETLNLDSSWTNCPSNTNYFNYASSGAGWTRDTSNKVGGVASLQTGSSGNSVDIVPAAGFWTDADIFEMEFMAKAGSGGSATVSVNTLLTGNDKAIAITITDTSWKRYSISIPIEGTTLDFLTIAGSAGNVNMQHFQFRARRFN